MKRTALSRKTPLNAKTGIKRQTMKRTSRSKTQKRKAQSDTRWRSEVYLDWIRALPCCLCNRYGSDPHHVKGLRWNLSGGALTAPDSYAMPLCRVCHSKTHNEPALQQLQPRWLRSTLEQAVAEFPDEPELARALAFVRARE